MYKVRLWDDGQEEQDSLLIKEENIEERYYVGDCAYYIDNVPVDDQRVVDTTKLYDQFTDFVDDYEGNSDLMEQLEAFFKSLGFEDVEIHSAPEYEDIDQEDTLIYDYMNDQFYTLSYTLIVDVYDYWDGHNQKLIVPNEAWTEDQLDISDDSVCLDEWDGHNFVTGGIGRHDYVHKVFNTSDSDRYLLVHTSQWEGELPTGKLMSRSDVEDYLKEIGRTDKEYIDQLDELDKKEE